RDSSFNSIRRRSSPSPPTSRPFQHRRRPPPMPRAERHPMESSVAAIAIALAAMPLALSDAAEAADALLSGAIASAAGEKLGGVTVSAKAAGQTITTTVFTDETGKYYFPPLPTGTYRVWAQTLSFATAKSEVHLSANRRQDFTLVSLKEFVQQLPGD